jgi:hypothetical protein
MCSAMQPFACQLFAQSIIVHNTRTWRTRTSTLMYLFQEDRR